MAAYKQHFKEQEKSVVGRVWTGISRMSSQSVVFVRSIKQQTEKNLL